MSGPSVFHWKEPKVVTAMREGEVVIWDVTEDFSADQGLPISRVSFVYLQTDPITTLTVTDR